jgi:putative membrane protein
MLSQALAAWAHFAAIFILVAALATELALYRRELSHATARLLARVDAVYGGAAGAVLATGLARALWFGKGWAFYAGNPVFWSKLGVFALVALLSVPPTVHMLRWRKALAAGQPPTIGASTCRRMRALLLTQAALLLLLPLLAALMARGIGLT